MTIAVGAVALLFSTRPVGAVQTSSDQDGPPIWCEGPNPDCGGGADSGGADFTGGDFAAAALAGAAGGAAAGAVTTAMIGTPAALAGAGVGAVAGAAGGAASYAVSYAVDYVTYTLAHDTVDSAYYAGINTSVISNTCAGPTSGSAAANALD